MHTPEADIASDAELVARLVDTQHPDLAGPLTLVSDGWDNLIYRLGSEYAVRIPRREVAAHLIEHEQQVLPAFAARVDVPIPAPVRVGTPSELFPFAWSIVRWVDGVDGADVTAEERASIALPLAAFVAALHEPATGDIPANPVRGVPLATRDAAVQERLRHLSERREVAGLAEAWRDALDAPVWDGPPIWLHGDLHPGNLLLTPDRSGLAAVVDFGDVTAGDPATDLATAWLTFDPDARAVFRDELTGRSPSALPALAADATWRRARGWAVVMGSALAANSDDNPRMASIATHALAQFP
ncbi:aminoglycoside phosphotransferase family protein [Leifsonia sp. NCR5]|uniref:aminoglycoside phosphotransferase family protein n=1 Tax=Leifsonia sp. NCR5 TaxID=1978342 RepID=UPI000A1970AB|nr:aminoglycoside phosphotransferase family protein [Leifsonia sp. NCR5]